MQANSERDSQISQRERGKTKDESRKHLGSRCDCGAVMATHDPEVEEDLVIMAANKSTGDESKFWQNT